MTKKLHLFIIAAMTPVFANAAQLSGLCSEPDFKEEVAQYLPPGETCKSYVDNGDHTFYGAVMMQMNKNKSLFSGPVAFRFLGDNNLINEAIDDPQFQIGKYFRLVGDYSINATHGMDYDPDLAYETYRTAIQLHDVESYKKLAEVVEDSRPDMANQLLKLYYGLPASLRNSNQED